MRRVSIFSLRRWVHRRLAKQTHSHLLRRREKRGCSSADELRKVDVFPRKRIGYGEYEVYDLNGSGQILLFLTHSLSLSPSLSLTLDFVVFHFVVKFFLYR